MSSVSPLKRIMNWLNYEEDEEGYEPMESSGPSQASPQPTPPPKRQRGPLTLHPGTEGGLEIRHPRSLEDRRTVGNDLKQGRMVTLDLTKLADSDGRLFLEFVYGVTFALDATVEKVNDNIYLLAPRGVNVRNDVEEDPVAAAKRQSNFAMGEQEEFYWQVR